MNRVPCSAALFGLAAAGLAAIFSLGAEAQQDSETFRLELPLDCEMGSDCVVQHYVDQAPGAAARDHTCGSLTYQGHKGTDIRTLRYAQMYDGVDVLAAAPGEVTRIRDRMEDKLIRNEADIQAIKDREAGNGVVIDHGNGWETQYSHLKRGSVVVRPGDRVVAGQPVGQIGLSGKTQFPHLHFSLRRDGKIVDPFTGLAPESGCGETLRSWWSKAAQEALAYRPGGLLGSGFAGEVLEFPAFFEHKEDPAVSSSSPALIVWMVAWGLRAGDLWTLRITGPTGKPLIEKTQELPANKIRWYGFIGRKRPQSGWPQGPIEPRSRSNDRAATIAASSPSGTTASRYLKDQGEDPPRRTTWSHAEAQYV